MAACMNPAAMESVALLLKDHSAEWTLRMESLSLIRNAVISSSNSNESILSFLTELQPLICIQLEDRRSIYCKEVCELITTCATRLSNSFESLSVGFITALFRLVVVTIKIIAESAHKCILSILPFSTSSIPVISQGIKDKHPALRARCTSYMCLVVESSSVDQLNNDSCLEAIDDAIRNAIADSNAEARTLAKRSYQSYNKRFPGQAQKLFSSLDSALQNRLVEAKPAPKKGGFADFLAKKQAVKTNNIDCGALVQDTVLLSKTSDDNDNEGNNGSSSSSSSSSSGSSSPSPSPSLSSSSSTAASSDNSSSITTSTTSPPATQSHSLTVDVVAAPITEIITPLTTEPEEKIIEQPIMPVSEPVVVEPVIAEPVVIAETPATTEPSVVEVEIAAPSVVESITSSMEITPPSPALSSSSSSDILSSTPESTELPLETVSSPSDETEIEAKLTLISQAEPELAVVPDDTQATSSSVDERPALSELLSEATEKLPSPLSDRRSIESEEMSASPVSEPISQPVSKAITKSTTNRPIIKPTTTLKSTKTTTPAPLSSTTSRPLRSVTNITKSSTTTTTTTKEPTKKATTSTSTTSKKITRSAYSSSEDKENHQGNIVRSSSTEPKPAKKLRVATPTPTETNSIAARVKQTRRAATVSTTTIVKSSSSSSKSSSTLKSKTSTKRPWL